eukprot:5809888-Amphidinium_carterae.1
MFGVLDKRLGLINLRRDGTKIQSDLVDVMLDLGDQDMDKSAFGHCARELMRRHALASLALRRPHEFAGCEQGLVAEWAREALQASATKQQYVALKGAFTGAYLVRERLSRHSNGKHSPLCSQCGAVETMQHVVMECPALPQSHRRYTRTGLPCEDAAVRELGKADFVMYTHHLASCLVRRN